MKAKTEEKLLSKVEKTTKNSKKTLFLGTSTALVTPFNKQGKRIDFKSLEKLIDLQLESGLEAITILGTTGEPATLTTEEQASVIKFAVNKINGRMKIIVGAGGNNTQSCIKNCKLLEKIGRIDAFLIVTPYYNKCTQAGLIKHYTKIADSISTPIILYNVPARTNVNIEVETVKALSKHPRIVAIKEASGNLNQIANIIRCCDCDFSVYSGDDALTLPILALGAKGVISVTANAKPKEMQALCKYAQQNDFNSALKLHYELLPLFNALGCEVNPIPIKYLLYKQNLIRYNTLRLPLTPLASKNKAKIDLYLNATPQHTKQTR